LQKCYDVLGRKATGKVAIKLSMGEPGGHNFLNPDLVKQFIGSLNGTIVDCNTGYGGKRDTTESHLKAAEDHGWTKIAPVDIMDSEGEVSIPTNGGKILKEDVIGKKWLDYDFTVVLSHFKGHVAGGFGGALKNISIGIASHRGKRFIHSGGKTGDAWEMCEQDKFLESMADASKAIVDKAGDKILYISVMNNLSVDCDCDAHPADPKMKDIGILSSLDPVALDKACVDLVYASDDPGKKDLIERMESRHGIHTVECAEQLGIGTQQYELIDLDKQ